MFVDRLKELRSLKIVAEELEKKERMNLAIIGNRRIGKTELLLEFKSKFQKNRKLLVPYLNVQRVGDINSFIFSYYRELLFEIGQKKGLIANKINLVTWDDILILSAKLNLDDITEKLKRENGIDALAFLFESQEEILQRIGFTSVFLLDEFQYSQNFGKRFFEVMRSIVEKQKKSAFIVTGSSISLMENIFSQSQEPFFAQFRRLYLGPLQKQDCIELAKTLLEKHELDVDLSSSAELFRLTNGHPFYVVSICRRLIEGFDDVNIDKIRNVFLEETLSPTGDIYLVLDYIFNESLSRAYKGEFHRQILLTLAHTQGLTLTEIAQKLGKPSGEVSNYMKILLKTDLLDREENNYYFRDPLLAFWLKNTYLGVNNAELEKETVRQNLILELTEKYLKLASELGKAKEYEFKVMLQEKFGIKLKKYVSFDGQLEFDLIYTKDDVNYIFEAKWRNKPAGYNDIKNFLNKIEKSNFLGKTIKLYFISKTGFTDQAKELAKEKNIILLDKKLRKMK